MHLLALPHPHLCEKSGLFLQRNLKKQQIMKKILMLAAAVLLLSCSCHQNFERVDASRCAASVTKCLSGSDTVGVVLNVSRVIDGDTFEGRMTVNTKEAYNPGVNPWAYELTKVTVRISGIDAPERGQFYGDVATLHLQWLISGKAVGLKLKQRDSYGRWIATAYLDGADIAEELLKEGLAWHYKEYDSNSRYAQLEAEARQDGRGLWSDDRAVPPWEWRRMSKYERDAYR